MQSSYQDFTTLSLNPKSCPSVKRPRNQFQIFLLVLVGKKIDSDCNLMSTCNLNVIVVPFFFTMFDVVHSGMSSEKCILGVAMMSWLFSCIMPNVICYTSFSDVDPVSVQKLKALKTCLS